MRSLFLIILYILTLTALITAIYGAVQREARHSLYITLFSIAISFFALGSLIILASNSSETAFVGFRIQHVGQPFIGGLWFLYIMDLCGYSIKKNYIVAILLSLPVAMSICVTFGDPWHLFINSLSYDSSNIFPYVIEDHTRIYRACLIHIYGFNIISNIFLLFIIIKQSNQSRMPLVMHLCFGLIAGMVGIFAILINTHYKREMLSTSLCIFSIIIILYLFKSGAFKVVSKAKYQLFESIQDGIVIINNRNKYMDANDRAKQIFPVLTKINSGTCINTLKDSLPFLTHSEKHKFAITSDNASKHYTFTRSELLEDQRNIGTTFMIYDVTDIVNLQKNLEYAVKTAEAASQSKSAFLATMSHEIRTPLNAIIGISQVQLQDEDLPCEQAKALESIYKSGNNLLGIINDILDMSKIETGKLELNPIEYSLPGLINDAVQLNIVRIGSKPIEFTLQIDENLPQSLYGDELRIKQILNNLLSNAIKYTARGTVELSASHIANGEDVTLRFIVRDTGQGIRPEDQQNLFSKYLRFNAASNRTTEGTGLGLNITKKLVEMMGGMIRAESEYNKGSVFTVEIKQKMQNCPAIGPKIAKSLQNFTFAEGGQTEKRQITHEEMPYGSVLIVDDVKTNLHVAQGLLAPYKLQIEMAVSGFATIKKVEGGKIYDVIFMDHMMPKMDGIETTQKLRAAGYTGAIVALTANALVGNSEMFRQNGFDGFISKPIDVRQLDAILNQFIRDKHQPPRVNPPVPPRPDTEAQG